MLELLKTRRSIRKYKATKIEKEKVDLLMKAALLSPSSRSIRPWEFVIVTDEELIGNLAKSKEHGSLFLKEAPLAIVILGDETKSDVWIEDASIASIIIQLAAESIGLGSCWIQIRERRHNKDVTSEEFVRRVLNIPKNLRVEAIIAIGYPDEKKSFYDEKSLLHEKVYVNQYK
ncbi:nitroreductase family protein [Natronincola ferrireducens]|uniref:Nitroreductase n=1 Tax=Natronincola ferrireducens TaxID=393762 RepID=A0A1G9A9Y8_9FIRM|nr:nitroreductase family protein [Natronincola ferrireducens]SDK24083.1 Nitroreductase [Natronincola ferrireducens]